VSRPSDPSLDGLRGRRLERLGGRPVSDEGGRALLFHVDLGLDDGTVWRIERDDTPASGAIALRLLPAWEPDMPALSDRAPWSGLRGAAIAQAASLGLVAPVPPPPPEPSGDDALDAWRYGPEDWAAWHFALDAKPAFVRHMLGLSLDTGAELMLTASGRSEAPALAPGVVIMELVSP
jgi:hypothetical protein